MSSAIGQVTTQAVAGHSGIVLMARLVGQGGLPVTQATINSVEVQVTDLTLVQNGQAGSVNTYTPAVASVIFNALQQTPPWSQDNQYQPGTDGLWGYNFLYVVPAVNFENSGDTFQIDVAFVPAAGEQFEVSFLVPTVKTFI
ncbi:MAG TPA: hypothetical protein VK395_22245 [Gemmataceae bacterium]|nr:hypothetical protein [Gemmataceae bacterium]